MIDMDDRSCEICGCDMSEFGIHKPIAVCDECEQWAREESHDAMERTDACYEHDDKYYEAVTARSRGVFGSDGASLRAVHDRVRRLYLELAEIFS